MSDWLNHVSIAAPRNGLNTRTVTSSDVTVVSGANFVPTSGRLLICIVYGAITSTTPSGWTLPQNGSAVNNGGLYIFSKEATGSDALTTTHNGSNYPAFFDFYEFPAGSTLAGVVNQPAVAASGGAGPVLTGLSGTNWLAAVVGQVGATTINPISWSAGTKLVDSGLTSAGGGNGYDYSLAEWNSDNSSTKSAAATVTSGSATVERFMIAVSTLQGGMIPTADAGANQNDIEPWSTVRLSGSGSSTNTGSIVSYTWQQVSGTAVSLVGSGVDLQFESPARINGATLVFSLIVTDSNGKTSDSDTVTVTVLPPTTYQASGSGWQPMRITLL